MSGDLPTAPHELEQDVVLAEVDEAFATLRHALARGLTIRWADDTVRHIFAALDAERERAAALQAECARLREEAEYQRTRADHIEDRIDAWVDRRNRAVAWAWSWRRAAGAYLALEQELKTTIGERNRYIDLYRELKRDHAEYAEHTAASHRVMVETVGELEGREKVAREALETAKYRIEGPNPLWHSRSCTCCIARRALDYALAALEEK